MVIFPTIWVFYNINNVTTFAPEMKTLFILALSALSLLASAQNKTTSMAEQNITLTQEWDKTFALSEKVNHEKVTFKTQYGFTIAADLYVPKDLKTSEPHNLKTLPALAVCGPFGAVKEQCSGLYAMTMAERGFITLAFDPSFTGESSGKPRRTASPDINTEDFLAAVDYLSLREDVDAEKIGIIGICGWGGIALNAAAIDPRIKATAVMTMYDMSRVNGNGYFDADNSEAARFAARKALAAERMKAAQTGNTTAGGGVVDPLPEDAPQFVKDYYDYYKTPRGYHVRSGNSNDGWHTFGCQAYANTRFLYYINEIRNAVLIVHGEKAHSRYFGENAFEYMMTGKAEGYDAVRKPNPVPENKELLIIPGASHCDLYDGGKDKVIPWDKLELFFNDNLK